MSRCLQLAELGIRDVAPNPMVGAVLVADDGQVLAEGWHMRYGEGHAEVNCFRDADERGVTPEQIHEATLYVSLEPCSHYGKTPPCALLIKERRPKCVVCGTLDPNPKVSGRGVSIIREAGIEVRVGVLEKECRWLNRRFLMLQENKRPYVILKWAQTADGFIDRLRTSSAEEVLTISTPVTKKLVHRMRSENMAILVGSRTALLDNPKLKTTRWTGRNPIRVLLDRHHLVPADWHILQDADLPSDYPSSAPTSVAPSSASISSPASTVPSSRPRTIVYRDRTDWPFVLEDLATRGIHSLIVEGGRQVLTSLLESGLYDEIHIEVNPRLTIGEGVPAPVFGPSSSSSSSSSSLPLSAFPSLDSLPFETVDGNRLYTLIR